MKGKQRILLIVLVLAGTFLGISGCGKKENRIEKIRDLEFTVVSDDHTPDELRKMIEEKKEQPFKFSYQEEGFTYICVGYGMQETGGYSICVEDLYLTKNAVYVDTKLLGPSKEDATAKVASFPYIILKLESVDASIVFK